MSSDHGHLNMGRRIRRVVMLVLIASALMAGGAIAWSKWLQHSTGNAEDLSLLRSALAEFDAGRYDLARDLLDRRAAAVTPTPLDWMLRARVDEAQGRLEPALAHLKQIPDSDPIAASAWLKAGQIELARHHARAAEAAYLHALSLQPELIQAHSDLTYLYGVQHRKAACDAQFRVLVRLRPLDHAMAFAWSQNDCDLWDVPGARKVLIPFVAEDPTDRDSRLALATGYVRTGEFDPAEAALEPLADSDPDARALRAQIAIDRGDIETAEPLVQNSPEDHARLNYLRGRLALYHNDPRLAAEAFRAALKQDPTDRDSIHGLGAALRNLGDPRFKEFLEAASHYDSLKQKIKDSLTSLHTDRTLFDKLGEICEAMNLVDQARVWYRLAIRRDPLDAEAQKALARLDRLASEMSAASPPKPRPEPAR